MLMRSLGSKATVTNYYRWRIKLLSVADQITISDGSTTEPLGPGPQAPSSSPPPIFNKKNIEHNQYANHCERCGDRQSQYHTSQLSVFWTESPSLSSHRNSRLLRFRLLTIVEKVFPRVITVRF